MAGPGAPRNRQACIETRMKARLGDSANVGIVGVQLESLARSVDADTAAMTIKLNPHRLDELRPIGAQGVNQVEIPDFHVTVAVHEKCWQTVDKLQIIRPHGGTDDRPAVRAFSHNALHIQPGCTPIAEPIATWTSRLLAVCQTSMDVPDHRWQLCLTI